MLRIIVINLTALTVLTVGSTRQSSFGADITWPGWLGGPERDGWVDDFQPS
jgi:hypothetical protein